MNKLMTIIISILFIGIGIFAINSGDDIANRCTIETKGTILEIVEEKTTDPKESVDHKYYPVIAYDAGAKKYEEQSKNGSNPSKYKAGQEVDMYYNKEDPQDFYIKGEASTGSYGYFFIIIGILALVFGVRSLILGYCF